MEMNQSDASKGSRARCYKIRGADSNVDIDAANKPAQAVVPRASLAGSGPSVAVVAAAAGVG